MPARPKKVERVPLRPCSKCGSDAVTVRYFNGKRHRTREFLAVTCEVCGFSWRENTLPQRKT